MGGVFSRTRGNSRQGGPSMLRTLAATVIRFRQRALRRLLRAGTNNESYWTGHNITNHQRFPSAQASLEYLDWRNDQYPGYIDLMPVSGQDGQVVLDYGCGPG